MGNTKLIGFLNGNLVISTYNPDKLRGYDFDHLEWLEEEEQDGKL